MNSQDPNKKYYKRFGIDHMTELERAYYYIGNPIATYLYVRQISRKLEPKTLVILNWVATWLSQAEREFVTRHAKIDFDQPRPPPVSRPTDRKRSARRKRLDLRNENQAYCLVGKAIVLRLRHTEIHRTFNHDIRAVMDMLNHYLSPHDKEKVLQLALIEFDAPGRPLPRFRMPPDPEIPF